MYPVANEQGSVRGESVDSNDGTSDSMINDPLFGVEG